MDTFGLSQLSFADAAGYMQEFFGAGIIGDFIEILIGVSVVGLVVGVLWKVVLK